MLDIYSQSRVTCLTYIHRPPRQPAQRASSKRAPKPSKVPHTARRSEPAPSKSPPTPRAHTRPATQPHQGTHEPAHCPGTNAGRGPPATDQSACEWHSKRAVRVVAAPARPVDTRSQSSRAIQAAVSACNHYSGCESHWLTIGLLLADLQHRKCQTARQKSSRRWARSSTPAAA